MKTRANYLLLFSKLPKTGRVKTRLTYEKDGILDPEIAKYLYHCMLFDVTEICMSAFDRLLEKQEAAREKSHLDDDVDGGDRNDPYDDSADDPRIVDTYTLVISTAPETDLEDMKKLYSDSGAWPREIVFISDSGASFDEHYNDAFEQVWAMGADCILSMGADMPALRTDDVVNGFESLHRLDETTGEGIVIAPDQELGVSIIGWTKKTIFDHNGVFYNRDGLTVLPAYIAKAKEKNLPAIYLSPVPDVDTIADLMHTITLVEALMYCSTFDGNRPPYRTWNALNEIGLTAVRIPPNELMDPRDGIDVDQAT